MTEFESLSLSEYLVGTWLVGTDRLRLKESAITIRSSLIEEWWINNESQRLLQMLKSPIITRRLQILISVSLRYFITEWEKSKYTFITQKSSLLMKKKTRIMSLWSIMFLQKEKQKEDSLILMKIMTLGQSFDVTSSLAKMS